MPSLIIELTDLELKALSTVCIPTDWAENAVKSRASIAINDIIQTCIAKCIENEISIPSTKDEIIDLAIEREWIHILK